MDRNWLFAAARPLMNRMVAFAQRLIQTPSLPGEEGGVARLVMDEMKALGFDDVHQDRAGNVIGLVRGGRPGPSLVFNTHLDHVDVGDPASWPYPPYGGEIQEGYLWGRGACDLKGSLAAQVYALAALKAAGVPVAGDRYFTGVVMEEVGGLGTVVLLRSFKPDLAIIGEATANQVARGHRGRLGFIVRAQGRSAHASRPDRGVNPHYVLAHFLTKLPGLEMASAGEFGRSSVAPTLYSTDQTSSNVIPAECRLHLDWRSVPGETPEGVIERLRPLLTASLIPGSTGSVELATRTLTTCTGLTETLADVHPAYGLPGDHPVVRRAQALLSKTFQRPVETILWDFATDGGHLARAGVPTIGFGPGEERYAHTVNDRLSLVQLQEAMVGNLALAMEMTNGD